MHPVFFKLTLWSDPQEWDVRPIFRDAAWGSSRSVRHSFRPACLCCSRSTMSLVGGERAQDVQACGRT